LWNWSYASTQKIPAYKGVIGAGEVSIIQIRSGGSGGGCRYAWGAKAEIDTQKKGQLRRTGLFHILRKRYFPSSFFHRSTRFLK
jgi:hypothetical protein